MNIEKAINRIQWRFKNENVKVNESKITITKQDIDSVDFLINWINNQKKEAIKENILFAKIYCYALSHEIEFYKDIKFANKQLQQVLELPIENHYNKIANDLNRLALNNYLHSIGINTDHLKRLNDIETQKEAEILKENQKEVQKYVLGIWNVKNVYKSLNNQITECINKFKNNG